MKFQKKLSITFMKVFFAMFFMFGFGMIIWSCKSTLKDTISYNLNIYATLLTKMDGVEGAPDSRKDAAKLEQIGSNFLESLYSPDIEIFIKSEDGKDIYSSQPGRKLPENGRYYAETADQVEYKIIGKYLYISSLVSYHTDTYYLNYSVDISSVYTRILQYAVFLLLFLIGSGIVAAYVITSFSKRVTKPLDELAEAVQKWDDSGKLEFQENSSDITEIHILFSSFQKMENEIQEKIEELQQQNDEKQRFIDSLTHEIRTPLTSIIGYSSLMESMPYEKEKAKMSFHMIHDNGIRLRELTENLVRLISLKEDEIRLEQFSLYDLLVELRNTFAVRGKEENAEIEISGEDIMLVTDRGLFGMMISNFVDNALKAVKNMPTKRINLIINTSSICVSDTGKGIPAEDIDKIFEPFFMVDRSRKRDTGGFGLGLSINDSIRRKLDMKIEVKSKVGQGTTIIVEFPEKAVL